MSGRDGAGVSSDISFMSLDRTIYSVALRYSRSPVFLQDVVRESRTVPLL
jgi:hypothetical protein